MLKLNVSLYSEFEEINCDCAFHSQKDQIWLVKDSSKDYWRVFVYVVTQFMRKKALWFAAEIKASKLKPTRADDMIESGSTPSCTQTGQARTGPDAVH